MRKGDSYGGGRWHGASSPSRSLPSFLRQRHKPSIDRRATLLRAARSLARSLAQPSRHADRTGILNARREADCLTACAEPRSLDNGIRRRGRPVYGSEGARSRARATGYCLRSLRLLVTRPRAAPEGRDAGFRGDRMLRGRIPIVRFRSAFDSINR